MKDFAISLQHYVPILEGLAELSDKTARNRFQLWGTGYSVNINYSNDFSEKVMAVDYSLLTSAGLNAEPLALEIVTDIQLGCSLNCSVPVAEFLMDS